MSRSILFTNARDEQNILEWVIHHLQLGFTHIFIYDHKSVQPLIDKLSNLLDKITIERLDHDMPYMKGTLVNRAYKYAVANTYDWMLYLDCDEFLILNKFDTVSNFLQTYSDYQEVGLNLLNFGSNHRDSVLDPNETILGTYTKCEREIGIWLKSFLHVKTAILKQEPGFGCNLGHCYVLQDMSKAIGVNFKPMDVTEPRTLKIDEHYSSISAYIAHHIFQSYDTYYNRKIRYPRDDTGTIRTDIFPREVLHNLFNQETNLFPSEKYDANNKIAIDKL